MVAPSSDRWWSSWSWVAVPILAWSAAGAARARDDDASWRCGESKRPWVELRFEEGGWEPKLQQSIRADLAAGLRTRGLLVCAPDRPGSGAPLASVQLSAAAQTRVAVEIEVHDALTNKYVLREVDTRPLPADARGLALATAAEELLRASWAELALEDAPEPSREPPPEVVAAVRPVVTAPRDGHVVGLRMVGEHHSAGQTLLGPDVWFDVWFNERFALELAIGYRRGLTESSKHGSVASEAAVFSGDALFSLVGHGSPVLLMMRAGFSVASLGFEGRPRGNNSGYEQRGLSVALRAALVLRLAIAEIAELRLDLGPGINIRAVTAVDDGEDATGTRGVLGHACLGFGVVF